MVEPASAPDRPADALVYRPLSGLALASLLIGGSYSALVAVLGLNAFFSRAPLFLGTWTLLIPVTAVALALAARRQILRSEETLSGAAMARWGLRVSLLFGFGYAAYHLATFWAVCHLQAAAFTNDWFNKLQKGEINDAFLFTQEPERRNPKPSPELMKIRYERGEGGGKGPLATFRESEMVRIIRQGGPDMTIQELGVKNWEYDQGGYVVLRSYRITTHEGVFNIQVNLFRKYTQSVRDWKIPWDPNQTKILSQELTLPGLTVQKWRNLDARLFVVLWLQKRSQGDLESVFLDSCEPSGRVRLWREYRARRFVAELALAGSALGNAGLGTPLAAPASLVTYEQAWTGYLAGYGRFADDLVRSEGTDPDKWQLEAPLKWRAEVIKDARELFSGPSALQLRPMEENGYPELPANDRLRIGYNLVIQGFPKEGPIRPPNYVCEARLVVESDRAPNRLDDQPSWRVVRLELLRANEPAPEPPMNPGGANRPGPP